MKLPRGVSAIDFAG